MNGASRWNEGKLHLGYTYTGTASLATARLMLEGTAHFERVVCRVCRQGIAEKWWSRPVVYLVDPGSVFPVEELWTRAYRVAALLHETAARMDGLARYLDPPLARLTLDEARALTRQQRIAGAWHTGERAVSPLGVAGLIVDSVTRRDIELVRGDAVSITRADSTWSVECEDGRIYDSRGIINASWESRARLDRPLETTPKPISIRYKVGLFGSGKDWGHISPSTRILGAYGDVTPYGNDDIYLSWYPAGLLAASETGDPPVVPSDFDCALLTEATLSGLNLQTGSGTAWMVRGGYVVAEGKGEITDPRSTLHERHRPGVRVLAPRYVSVDTGKYTLGPLLAEQGAESLLAGWNGRC